MAEIVVRIPRNPQKWQLLIVERLGQLGHRPAVVEVEAPNQPLPASLIVGLETALLKRGKRGLAAPVAVTMGSPSAHPVLTVDLSGNKSRGSSPTLRLAFNGGAVATDSLAALLRDELPELEVLFDDKHVAATASPMRDDPAIVIGSYEATLARAVTLMVATADRFLRDPASLRPSAAAPATPSRPGLIGDYIFSAFPRLLREIIRRRRYRYAHWRVGYRFSDGPYVPEMGALGSGWSMIPDDGSRFYADPFPFTFGDRSFVFVEDYPHATRKAVIAVAEIEDGRAAKPRLVLEEPHHLSYPQVFSRDGEIWMLPEGGGGRSLTLYRALAFPDRWEKHAVLIEGREISDATLLERDGRLWLFATDRDGYGSTSDTLVVYSAVRLEGPWVPHRDNPILIDRAAARPGGAFIAHDGRLLLPVQDGTVCYGGGLGFAEITRVDDEEVKTTRPRAVAGPTDWPHPQIHTYNRDGRLEVIDGIVAVRK